MVAPENLYRGVEENKGVGDEVYMAMSVRVEVSDLAKLEFPEDTGIRKA